MKKRALDPQARRRVEAACAVVNKEIEEESRKVLFVTVAVGIIALVCMLMNPENWRVYVGVTIAVSILFRNAAKKRVAKTYKGLVVRRIIAALDRGLTYSHESSLEKADFNGMDLFNETPDSFVSEDEICGEKAGVSYSVHEVRSSVRRGKHMVDLFSGLIVRLDFNKNFYGHTIVIPDQEGRPLGSMLGDLLERSRRRSLSIAKLENPDFESIFSVYTTNDQESRYLLTPKLMELALEANARYGGIRIAFVENSLFVTVPLAGDRLEGGLDGPVSPESALEELLGVVDLAERLIDTFDLETRIWSRA